MSETPDYSDEKPCPCHSGQSYGSCCAPYHKGLQRPPTAKALMRSRYAAYALRLADYIIHTTHPDNPQFTKDHKVWKEQILEFCYVTEFYGLDIIEVKEGETTASVTFHAKLRQRGQEASFSERSHFVKVGGNWLYHSGEVSLEK